MKLLFYMIITAIVITSCVSQRKSMDSWIGATAQDLILKWGPPARTTSDGGSGQIYIFERQYYLYNTMRYDHKMFYADSNSRIYSWRTASGPVPAQQLNINLYIR